MRPAVDPQVTLVLVGPPGEGKSTLGNLLAAGWAHHHANGDHASTGLPFQVSEGFESDGEPAVAADFDHQGIAHRVIDTTGSCCSALEVASRLESCAGLVPCGLDAFVFVIQKGRFTDCLSNQLMAFQDAAGPGALARTIVAFTHCGQETTDQLLQRCALAQNLHLQSILARVAAVVAVESSLAARHAKDRVALLGAARQACLAHTSCSKPRPIHPVELQCMLKDMQLSALAVESGERRDALWQKLQGIRAGSVSLEAARAALNEAEEQQRFDAVRQRDRRALIAETRSAQLEAQMFKGVANSVSTRSHAAAAMGQESFVLSCCVPTCQEACDPCVDELSNMLHEWRDERESEIIKRFAEADAHADSINMPAFPPLPHGRSNRRFLVAQEPSCAAGEEPVLWELPRAH